MIVGVLANDNPQGLLLAVRLLKHCRVRVSIGGRLGRLLEAGWRLQAEDSKGNVVEVVTRVLRRGEDNSTKEEEERSSQDVLWLCDWKDTASGWYSLGECSFLLQCSKATDSKTIAMWLVEVCKDDALIVSLQSGLHNARELRTVFGRDGGLPVAENMPLVANQPGRRTTGSVDTVDGGASAGLQSRRESASSIYSELEGNIDETIEPSERSASPIPPGLMRDLPSPTSSDSGGNKGEARRSMMSLVEEDEAGEEEEAAVSPTANRGTETKRLASQPSSESALTTMASPRAFQSSESAAAAAQSNLKKPNAILLAGVLGFGASGVVDETKKTLKCVTTHHGAIVLERLTKANALTTLSRILVLEMAGFEVRYRAHEETNNWLWGDVVWRTYEAYGAALRMIAPDESRSLYALLCDRDPIHRRVYAGLLEEALSALRWQKVELMDPASSPFGLSFRAARALLLLPRPAFKICLRIVLALRFPFDARVKWDSPYCDSTTVHRYMAPFLNGEVVRIGFEGEVQTPLNQEILEILSSAAKKQHAVESTGTSGNSPSQPDKKSSTLSPSSAANQHLVTNSQLPQLYSLTSFVSVVSCIVLLLAIFVRFLIFVVDVTFFW